jgi:hypothetical protein
LPLNIAAHNAAPNKIENFRIAERGGEPRRAAACRLTFMIPPNDFFRLFLTQASDFWCPIQLWLFFLMLHDARTVTKLIMCIVIIRGIYH